MAALNLVAALKRATLRPLGAEGRTVFAAQEQLRGLVASRLGPRHVALLAESLANDANDTIEWYSEAQPPFTRLTALDAARRDAAWSTLESLSAEIHGLAEELAKSTGERASAALLDLARRYPDESGLYVAADGQPIIVGWGFSANDGEAAVAGDVRLGWRAPVKEEGPAEDASPAQVDDDAKRRSWRDHPWVGWGAVGFAGGALLSALLWLVPIAAWLDPAGALERRIVTAQGLEAGLRQELASMQIDLAGDLTGCRGQDRARPRP